MFEPSTFFSFGKFKPTCVGTLSINGVMISSSFSVILFNVNETQAYKAMNYCFQNYDEVKQKALNLMKVNRDKFTLDKMSEKLNKVITPYVDKTPTQVGIQLPKLKKVGDDKSEQPKINLPKLKKITEKEGVPA